MALAPKFDAHRLSAAQTPAIHTLELCSSYLFRASTLLYVVVFTDSAKIWIMSVLCVPAKS